MRCTIAIMALLAGLLVPIVPAISPAAAATCPAGNTSAPYWLWTRSAEDVYGVRAPVQVRLDGGLCSGGVPAAFAAAWIGIQQQVGNHLAQIGFSKNFDANNNARWCRFWAIDTGAPHFYDCGTDANDLFVYFKISRYYDTTTRTYRYNVEDCGTGGGYGNCMVKSSGQAAFGNPEGIVSAETDYGCVVHIMGSTGDPQDYGTSSNPLQGLDNASWTTRQWGVQSTNCTSNYMSNQGPDGMGTWDSRNSG